MMSDAYSTTVPLLFENMMKTYLPSIDSDGFDHAYPTGKIQRIHAEWQEAVKPRPIGSTDTRRKEKIISDAWVTVDADETLCPGYLLNISENHADVTDAKKLKVDGALISTLHKDLIQKNRPNFFLDDLSIEFKRGGTSNDAWDDRTSKNMESRATSRLAVRGQLMSYGERHFYFQHRMGLFMLFVNGGEFRIIRWDRSGCIVTEALNYVETAEHTKKLLQFLYAYSKAKPEQRGIDTTATRLSKDSCGWKWMQKVAATHPNDLAHADGTVLASVPEGFVIEPTRDAPDSPLFATNILAEDPTATTGFGDLSSYSNTSAMVTPVFKYVRDLFRESIPETWMCYSLKVCGRLYLVGKPIFAPHGLVGRGTRGYVALEWKTQRLVFLKDAWRPFYHGVDQEGATLKILNDAQVPFVPTLVCHEDVGGGQETEASEYSATGAKKPDVFSETEREDRPIAPMPSRSRKASGSRSTTSGGTTRSASTSDSQPPLDATDVDQSAQSSGTGGRRSGKRARSQKKAPVKLNDGIGLRHLKHYRIVVAQVCLPSSAITSGKQLARVVWNCIDGHGDAAERCNILHRDVSAGNILILPTVHIVVSKTKGRKLFVLWGGVLTDWEVAKKCVDVHEVSKARQPHRTGTWYYMSVYSVQYPGSPVSIPDELESFLHVLLYLALRYLRSSLPSPGIFIDDYFVSSGADEEGRTLCGQLKQEVICNGQLVFNRKPVNFLPDPQPESESQHAGPSAANPAPPSPLNHLIADLLSHFKAHYAVREYNAAVKARELHPKPLVSLYDVITGTPAADDDEDDGGELLLAMRQKFGGAQKLVKPNPPAVRLSAAPLELQEPSDEDKRRAACLMTHQYVKDLFFEHIMPNVLWPSKDHVGDQLKGYVRAETMSKKPRLESTMATIVEEVSTQPESAA
ncbi:hypothetical protein LXA43DRAFT_954783 [Ganoderma leucocontextum]|nr:hypothetical protein LXA43DRAFT_954783 [Ganoderma leucocontextum]